MNQATTADIIKVVGQLLIEARELQELKKGLNCDYAPAELARMEERLAHAQSLLSQLCKDPVLAPTIWNPYPEVKPTAGRDYLVWIKDGGAGWQDQPAVERYSSRLQDFEGESPIIEDGGTITHWAEITPPSGCAKSAQANE